MNNGGIFKPIYKKISARFKMGKYSDRVCECQVNDELIESVEKINQFSLKIKSKHLARLLRKLANNGVNLEAIISVNIDCGIMEVFFTTFQCQEAIEVLEKAPVKDLDNEFVIMFTYAGEDQPGLYAQVVEAMKCAKVEIFQFYSANPNLTVVLNTSDNKLAVKLLNVKELE